MTDRPADADPTGHARDGKPEQDGSSPPASVRPHHDGWTELKVEFEITTLSGVAGRRLAARQATAIRAVLTWLAQNRPPTPRPHMRSSGEGRAPQTPIPAGITHFGDPWKARTGTGVTCAFKCDCPAPSGQRA
jgi:hypothetical protein